MGSTALARAGLGAPPWHAQHADHQQRCCLLKVSSTQCNNNKQLCIWRQRLKQALEASGRVILKAGTASAQLYSL